MSAALLALQVTGDLFKRSANLTALSFEWFILRFSRGDISEDRSVEFFKKFNQLVIYCHVASGG